MEKINAEEIETIQGKEEIEVQGSQRTPYLVLDKPNGLIKFSGYSLPEDSKTFYYPVREWIKEYIEEAPENTEVVFDMEYFNSSSSKMLLEILEILSKVYMKEKKVSVKWYYQDGDEDTFESGKHLEELVDLKFEFVCYL